jgi:hypothetical protein
LILEKFAILGQPPNPVREDMLSDFDFGDGIQHIVKEDYHEGGR